MALGSIQFGQGLASGLDFRKIVDALIKVQRIPIQRLESKIDDYETARSRVDDFGAKLSELMSSLETLRADDVIGGKLATLSDENAGVAVEAGAAAAPGSYAISVLDIARASRVRSNAVDDAYSPLVSDGQIRLQAGGHEEIVIDVSAASGNNSLRAIADTINNADQGVVASIINDGTGAILVVRSAETGTAHALTVSDTTNLGLADPANVLETATDALIEIDGIQITSSDNVIDDAVEGLTITVTAPTAAPVTLTVDRDVEGTKQAIRDFIDAYNAVNDFYNEKFGQVENLQGASLSGGATMRGILNTLQNLVVQQVTGIPAGRLQSASEFGIRVADRTGKLEFDESYFDDIVAQDRFDEVLAVLESAGSTTDPAVVFLNAIGDKATPGTYAVNITQAAERADVAGSTAVQATGIAQDETLTIDVNGTSTTVDLLAGDTIDVIVDKINTALQAAGVEGVAYQDAGVLHLRAIDYGDQYTISATSNVADAGDGSSTGIGTTTLTDTGQDVAGTIGGFAAEGNGQVLTGAEGTDVDGLMVQVYATATSVAAKGGDFGTVGYSRGVLDAMIKAIDDINDPFEGTLHSVTESLDAAIDGMQDKIDRLERRISKREELLVLQFAAAEAAIAQLQTMQASLAQAGSGGSLLGG
ncbi:MAG: hypothetical protein D6738_06575 [Acidobacteria bacterium]|nr:MAG: hypothetical protein D6738_06575 [Acidobacteriota bacterium]